MIFGVFMSTVNFNHFRRRSSIILEFLPQLLFLVLLFAYMCFMMFWKWVSFGPREPQPFSPGCAPSVLIYFINMMLFGENKPLDGCEAFMYEGQGRVQLIAVLVAVACIPWMLLGKPLYMQFCGRKGGHVSLLISSDKNTFFIDFFTGRRTRRRTNERDLDPSSNSYDRIHFEYNFAHRLVPSIVGFVVGPCP